MRRRVTSALMVGCTCAQLVGATPARTSTTSQKTKPPVWIARPVPDPSELRDACPTSSPGTPVVEAQLLSAGSVGDVKVVRSSGCKAADRLFVARMKRWKFKPAEEKGKPVTV